MDPSKRYEEASKVVEKEYGHPSKVLMAYVNKVLKWSPDLNRGRTSTETSLPFPCQV